MSVNKYIMKEVGKMCLSYVRSWNLLDNLLARSLQESVDCVRRCRHRRDRGASLSCTRHQMIFKLDIFTEQPLQKL